jgi:Acyclic terpene utilisation family protein AtuA
MQTIRIGTGAGFSGDRIEPAVECAQKGELDYLVFECLGERTVALAQQARRTDPAGGFDPLLIARFQAVLPICRARRIKIITNMGAANPISAARHVVELARKLGLAGIVVAAVSGDDVIEQIHGGSFDLIEREGTVADLEGKIIAANAYLGVSPIVEALAKGADVVITGRVSDAALFAAPMVYEFGWAMDDWDRLGKAMLVGHLIECAGHVTGGYFADESYKSVKDLARLGFPIAIVSEDGNAEITKVPGSGGEVTLRTCKEQLLYEIHDPAAYYQPDVVADFSNVSLRVLGPDRVAISGGTGRPRTNLLKVSIGYHDSYVGEGQISYAGPGALGRAQLALDIVRERFAMTGVKASELRFDIIGLNSVHRGAAVGLGAQPTDVRIRVIGRTETVEEAVRIGNEVESLWTSGPAGGGGASKSARAMISIASTLLPAAKVHTTISSEVT